MIDRDDLSTEVLDRSLTPARQAGAPAQVSVMMFQRGVNAFRDGYLDDAEADARASHDVCVEHLFQLGATLGIFFDHHDLVAFPDQPPGDQRGYLSTPGDEDTHSCIVH